MRKLQILLIKVVLVFCGIGVALGMAEAGARLMPPPYPVTDPYKIGQEMHRCDEVFGWRGEPDATIEFATDGWYEHTIHRNRHGMFDTEYAIPKPEDVFRIMVIGDSFVEALEVKHEEASHQVLERLLNEQAPAAVRFEVLSGGVSGWSPGQAVLYATTEGQPYEPDLVIGYWFSGNDPLDILPHYGLTYGGINCYTYYYAICDGQFDPIPWATAPGFAPTWKECSASRKTLTYWLNRLYYNSALYQQIQPIFGLENHQVRYHSDPFAPWIARHQDDPALQYSYDLTAGAYQHLATEMAVHGGWVALMTVPVKHGIFFELDPHFRNSLVGEHPSLHEGNPRLPNERFVNRMTELGLPVLDLHPIFIEHSQAEGESFYWAEDSHWNVAGNQKVAELLATWLIEQQLVPIQNNLGVEK